MASPLGLIIKREYYERVKRKSFIITTILVPILMLGLMAAPTLLMLFSSSEKKTVNVVDRTGVIVSRLENSDEIEFVSVDSSVDKLRANEDIEAILTIGEDAVENPDKSITLYTRGSLPMTLDTYINRELNNAIEDVRLEAYNIPDIENILEKVKTDVSYKTIRIDRDEDTETSSLLSYLLSITMDMILYMFILIYGQMVMTSIIEEKNNRVLEIVVSSVRPFTLMTGKIAGVGLVALTQIMIWSVLIGACSAFLLPMIAQGGDMADAPVEMTSAMAQLSDTGFMFSLFIYVVLFFIGGFLFYASIYAAIGSACSNVQDASQLSSIATMPVIIAILASMAVINDPDSQMAFWFSIIPFTSPMAMLSRLPFGVPFWETLLSLGLLYLSFVLMIWLCAKIYRIGIFMYGKKPTLLEIVKWAKQK